MYLSKIRSGDYETAMAGVEAIIVPIGSHEAHGPHCPLGTDAMIPERLCADIEARMGDRIAVAPGVNYGYTPYLAGFPGTVSIEAETLIALYTDIGTGLGAWGKKPIIFMNGHGGNIPMLTVACERIGRTGVVAAAISWWATFSSDVLSVCATQGHAGEDETSLVLALDEALVDRVVAGRHMRRSFIYPLAGPGTGEARFPEAMNGDASAASADKGQPLYAVLMERNLEAITRIVRGEYTDSID